MADLAGRQRLGGPPTATLSSTGASTTAATLVASLTGNDYVAVAKGSVVYLARVSGNNVFVSTAGITPGGSSSQGAGLTHTLTLAGPVNVTTPGRCRSTAPR